MQFNAEYIFNNKLLNKTLPPNNIYSYTSIPLMFNIIKMFHVLRRTCPVCTYVSFLHEWSPLKAPTGLPFSQPITPITVMNNIRGSTLSSPSLSPQGKETVERDESWNQRQERYC
jgi:hypothetical protein